MRERLVAHWRWKVAAVAAFVLPGYLLVRFILGGTRMQFGDYFYMLRSLYTDEGGFRPAGLLEHANEHLVALPKILIAINAGLFEGSNITLGVAVWFMSCAVFGILWWNLRGVTPEWSAGRLILLWLAVFTAFPLQALHNYVYSMSGNSWIMANAFALAAVSFMVRGRSIVAGLAGALATLSYGTGLVVWPALVLVAYSRRTRPRLAEAVTAVIGIAAIAAARVTSSAVVGHPQPDWNPLSLLRGLAVTVGSLFSTESQVASLVGIAVLTVLGAALVTLRADRSRDPHVLFVVGLAAYGIGSLTLIAAARSFFGEETFLASRYMTLSALVVFAAVVGALLAWGGGPVWMTSAVGVILLSGVAMAGAVQKYTEVLQTQDVLAVAARLGIADRGYGQGVEEGSSQLLAALGNYPFSSQFDTDCGLLGDQVGSRISANPSAVEGTIDNIDVTPNPNAYNVSGWLHAAESVHCILIVDETNTVLGAGVPGGERLDVSAARGFVRSDLGWRGVARAETGQKVQAVAVMDDSQLVSLGEPQVVP